MSEPRLRELLQSRDQATRLQGVALLEALNDPALDDALCPLLRVMLVDGAPSLLGCWPLSGVSRADPRSILARWAERCDELRIVNLRTRQWDLSMLHQLPRLQRVRLLGRDAHLTGLVELYSRLAELKVRDAVFRLEGIGQIPWLTLWASPGLDVRGITGTGTRELRLLKMSLPEGWAWVPDTVRRLTIHGDTPSFQGLHLPLETLDAWGSPEHIREIAGCLSETLTSLSFRYLQPPRRLGAALEALPRLRALSLDVEQGTITALPRLPLEKLTVRRGQLHPALFEPFSTLRTLTLHQVELPADIPLTVPKTVERFEGRSMSGVQRLVFPPETAPRSIELFVPRGSLDVEVHNTSRLQALWVMYDGILSKGVRLSLHGSAPGLEKLDIAGNVDVNVSHMAEIPPLLEAFR